MSYWQALAEILLPNRADFTRGNLRAERRDFEIYDGTPRLALRDLASTLDGLMKPKTSNWFDGEIPDDLVDDDDVKMWYQIVRDRMWKAIYRPDARFIQRSTEVDLDLACFGWGVLWIQETRARDGLLFKTFHNSRVAFSDNEDGIIDQLAVEEYQTPRQAERLYKRAGKPNSRKLDDALRDKKKSDMFHFVQMVLPREDRDARLIGIKGMPFASVVLDLTSEIILTEAGFDEFPAAVPRWDTAPGEIYARSPGMMALPDSKTLQSMGKTLLVGGQRAVDPPLWVLNDAVMSPLRTRPGGITVLDPPDGSNTPIGAFPISTNIPLGREMQKDTRAQIEAAFFKNVFNLPVQTRTMTATEILERKEEFIRTIGPVFGRLETDYIGHTVMRVFGIMERAGAFPARPDALQGRKISFRFQSPLQQARKQLEIAGLSRTWQVLEPLAQVQPEVIDHFNGDAIARDLPDAIGFPLKWLRSKADVEKLRQERAQQHADQMAAQSAEPLSKAIKNVADASAVQAPAQVPPEQAGAAIPGA